MNPYIRLTALALLYMFGSATAQSGRDGKVYTNLTFFFVDNSDGYNADALNNEMSGALEDHLNRITSRTDNCFFFYGCNGDNYRTSTNLMNFISSAQYKKYLENPSRESDYEFDKGVIRSYFVENDFRVKQTVELNIYLSTYATKRMLDNSTELALPLVFPAELPLYIARSGQSDYTYKVNVFMNQEVREARGQGKTPEEKIKNGEDRIRNRFAFGQSLLGNTAFQYEIRFL